MSSPVFGVVSLTRSVYEDGEGLFTPAMVRLRVHQQCVAVVGYQLRDGDVDEAAAAAVTPLGRRVAWVHRRVALHDDVRQAVAAAVVARSAVEVSGAGRDGSEATPLRHVGPA